MIALLLQRLSGWWQYVAVFVAFLLVQAFCFSQMLPLPHVYVLADAAVYAFTYLFLGLMLWSTLRYGGFDAQPIMQVILIYVALITLSVVVSYAVGYAFYEMLPGSIADTLRTFISVRMFVSLLVTVSLVQYNHFRICRIKHTNTQPETPDTDEQLPVTTLQPEAGDSTAPVELLERISVKSGSKIHVIPVDDVVCLQADGDYVQIHTMSGKYLKEQTMKYFEENLPVGQFVRVHRSFIVNVHSIARIELYDKQSQQLTLKNGEHIKVSQAGYKLLRSKLKL